MRYLGLITARGGSKRIPGKNVKLLAGYPLIWYTIQEAIDSMLRDGRNGSGNVIALSTDDPAIIAAANAYFPATNSVASIVPILRPAELATDTAEHIDVLKHAVEQFHDPNKPLSCPFDAVVTLHPTSPLRTAGDINAAMKQFEKSGGRNLVSVNAETRVRNAAIYITPIADLYSGDIKIYNNDSVTCEMPADRSLDINTPEDWLSAEHYLANDKRIFNF